MVEVKGLVKSFKDPKSGPFRAVDDVSFIAKPGEVFGLLGVNGAGKTTTLRMLSTVLTPDAGQATIDGCDVVKQSEKVRKRIGFLSTSTALYGRLTGLEVITYFGKLYGLRGKELNDRIAYVVEKLKLAEFADRLCDKLSTGQKQRVSIGRTILHDPPVLFFDEPTAGLDVLTAQTVLEFIEEVRQQGKTILFSTHIMSEAERLCDHIAVIHDGRIKGAGTVSDLLQLTSQTSLEKAFLDLVGHREAA